MGKNQSKLKNKQAYTSCIQYQTKLDDQNKEVKSVLTNTRQNLTNSPLIKYSCN